jgi:YHS domain-containing protein
MRRLAVFVLPVAVIACGRSAPKAQVARADTNIQTIDSTTPQPATLNPPPVLTDEGPPPKPPGNVQTADAPPPLSPQDEAMRAAMPFAPAIGLDPVDGSKISIRASTPSAEYKGHVFYFTSEANKRTFMASPDQGSRSNALTSQRPNAF